MRRRVPCSQFYNVALGPQIQSKLPKLYVAATQRLTLGPAQVVAQKMTTVGGTQFTLFTKNARWIGDIYSAVIADYYQSDVYVEAWTNGT